MNKTAINLTPGGWAQASHVSGASEMLFISGQVPQAADGSVPEDIEAQCRLVWDNLAKQLAGANMTFANLAKLTIFLTDRQYAKAMVAVRSETFNAEVQPAVTTVIADLFDERWLIEIEAIAVA